MRPSGRQCSHVQPPAGAGVIFHLRSLFRGGPFSFAFLPSAPEMGSGVSGTVFEMGTGEILFTPRALGTTLGLEVEASSFFFTLDPVCVLRPAARGRAPLDGSVSFGLQTSCQRATLEEKWANAICTAQWYGSQHPVGQPSIYATYRVTERYIGPSRNFTYQLGFTCFAKTFQPQVAALQAGSLSPNSPENRRYRITGVPSPWKRGQEI